MPETISSDSERLAQNALVSKNGKSPTKCQSAKKGHPVMDNPSLPYSFFLPKNLFSLSMFRRIIGTCNVLIELLIICRN